jgi:hypothetical protein
MRSHAYEITFKGQAGTTLRAEFDDCTVTVASCTTTLRAELPDQPALAGLVQRITGLGLEVVHLHLAGPATRTMTDPVQVRAQYPPAAVEPGEVSHARVI